MFEEKSSQSGPILLRHLRFTSSMIFKTRVSKGFAKEHSVNLQIDFPLSFLLSEKLCDGDNNVYYY
jgi:hypothetical protein